MKTLYILDAVNFLFRSYYAIRNMSTPTGVPTGALYGFIRSIQKIIKDYEPTHLIAVFDGPDNKKSRSALYADYKMHRKEMPQDLYQQWEKAVEYCSIAGIPHIAVPGVEADDTIGSITKWATEQGGRVFISSGDKDLCQLVSPHVSILNPQKDHLLIDEKGVEERFGVKPHQIVDFLAIMGDASDGIPGIPGMGEKTAAALLQECGTLENLLAHPEKAGSAKKQQLIIQHAQSARLSQKLASLDFGVEFPREESFFSLKPPHQEQLALFYENQHFLSLLKEMTLSPPSGQPTSVYKCIEREEELDELLLYLEQFDELCVDTETTSLSSMECKIVGIGIGAKVQEAFYIPLNGSLDKSLILKKLHPLLSTKPLYGHNIKFDIHALLNEGLPLPKVCFDTMLASYLLRPQENRHGLDVLTLERFGFQMTSISTLIGKGKTQITMNEVPIDQVAPYCCADVDYTIRLKCAFEEELKEKHLSALLQELELPLIFVLIGMERSGIYVDPHKLSEMAADLQQRIQSVEGEIFQLAGKEFNINSPKQLSQLLFEELKIEPKKKKRTETHPSTSAEVLESLRQEHPICGKILDYRTLEKLRSTYVESLPTQINPKTQRIHCSFNQSVAATGRLSCQDPNLQNIPIRSPEGKKIREAFRPQKQGWSFLSADYSQIELRLLAAFSKEPSLISAFKKGEDIHRFTAAEVFGVPLDEVTSEMRSKAKAVNFGILYGQQAYGLSSLLSIPMHEASAFIKTYFDRYPRVQAYIEESKERARSLGYAETLFGRKRPIPDISSKNPSLRAFGERLAVNTPLQGSQADIIKQAMLEIEKKITSFQGYMVLQIHDELIFELPDEELKEIEKLAKQEMEKVVSLDVPLNVNIQIGKNWAEC